MKNGLHSYEDGTKMWFLNGELHREDGPACEYSNGTKKWYLNSECVYSEYVNKLSDYDNLSEEFKQSIVKYELSK